MLQVLREYNDRLEKIEEYENKVEISEQRLESQKSKVKEAKDNWEPEIKKLTQEINAHFSKFMATLDCAGTVLLDEGKDKVSYLS